MNGLTVISTSPNSVFSTHRHIVPRIGGQCCSVIPRHQKSSFSSKHKEVDVVSSSGLSKKFPRFSVRCTSSAGDSGENVSKTTLDAFFLGKAIGEALNERMESALGEFVSVLGKFQAEQQKLVQEFQDEVFEKARQAKEKAAQEAFNEANGGPMSSDSTAIVEGVRRASSGSQASKAALSNPNSEDLLFGLMDKD